ncbi:MAG TPA: tail fiber domain-containing protein [Fimbriimonas sp.]|nr:tail fiber domain-containing protein [Fimbriimonas sp.]
MARLIKSIFAALAMLVMANSAALALCSSFPNNLTNGAVADASQVMANFNCAALTSGSTISGVTLTGSSNLGTPTTLTLTHATGLPISTGISGLGTGIAAFLATPSGSNLASALTSALTATRGGTGQTSYSAGDLLVASSSTSLTRLPAAPIHRVLVSNGSGTAPSWMPNVQVESLSSGGLVADGSLVTSFAANGMGVESAMTASAIQLNGSTNMQYRVAFTGSTSTALTANASYAQVVIGKGAVTMAPSGTTGLMASLGIVPPVFTSGAGTLTDAATVFIGGAPTGQSPTNTPNALWIAGGQSKFDGDLVTSANVMFNGIPGDTSVTDATLCREPTFHKTYVGTGTLGTCLGTSSARYKHGIAPLAPGLDSILALKPKSFYLNKSHGDPNKQMYGFIAEDMVTVLPKLVGLDKQGRPNTADYLGVVPVLVKAMQQQQAEITALKEQNAHLRAANDQFDRRLLAIERQRPQLAALVGNRP